MFVQVGFASASASASSTTFQYSFPYHPACSDAASQEWGHGLALCYAGCRRGTRIRQARD